MGNTRAYASWFLYGQKVLYKKFYQKEALLDNFHREHSDVTVCCGKLLHSIIVKIKDNF